MATFRELQSARDSATVLIGLGTFLLAASVGWGLIGAAYGFPFWVSWFGYYGGPFFLVTGLCLFWPGTKQLRRSKELRGQLDRDEDEN